MIKFGLVAMLSFVSPMAQAAVDGNVEVVKTCLRVTSYAEKLGALHLAIRGQGLEKALVFKADADEEFLDDVVLLEMIAGEHASSVLRSNDGFDSILSEAIHCINDGSCSEELALRATNFSSRLKAACKSDFWGTN